MVFVDVAVVELDSEKSTLRECRLRDRVLKRGASRFVTLAEKLRDSVDVNHLGRPRDNIIVAVMISVRWLCEIDPEKREATFVLEGSRSVREDESDADDMLLSRFSERRELEKDAVLEGCSCTRDHVLVSVHDR